MSILVILPSFLSWSGSAIRIQLDLDPSKMNGDPPPCCQYLHRLYSPQHCRKVVTVKHYYFTLYRYLYYRYPGSRGITYRYLYSCTNGILKAVLWIRLCFYSDLDPGSQKCPYGSGSKSKGVKKEEKLGSQHKTKSFKMTLQIIKYYR